MTDDQPGCRMGHLLKDARRGLRINFPLTRNHLVSRHESRQRCIRKTMTTNKDFVDTPQKRKRRSRSTLQDNAVVDFQKYAYSKSEMNEMNPGGMKSLVLPWGVLVLLGLMGVAATTCLTSKNDELLSEYQDYGSHEESSSLRSLVIRHLSTSTSHAPLLPLSNNDYVGFTLATLGLMVAAGGGIGGGGILVPIYILVMGFSPKRAIPLSNITVLGGAFANTFLNARKRHPLADRPLVDWDLILVMEPLTIAGALIGAFLNKLLPETLLVVMLVLLLSFTAYKSLTKACKMYQIETRHLQQAESELVQIVHKEEEEYVEEAEESLLDHIELQEGQAAVINTNDIDKANEDLKQILEEERVTPIGNVTMLVIMFIVVLFINLMKGGGAFPSPLGIKCGSKSFWIANGLMLFWIVVISWMARSYLVQRYHRKEKCGYKYVDGDIRWDERATIFYPLVCCLAGFFAGMFGVGGGIVKGPLMLQMGVHPAVSSGSSACMILFTSFTATTSFIVFGLLVPDYAVVCFVIGFIATLVGQIGLGILMEKYQRNSYIAFSIGGVVLLSAFLMTIQSLVAMVEGKPSAQGGICGASGH